MKKSDQYLIRANEAENDMQQINLEIKARKEKRAEDFEAAILPGMEASEKVASVERREYFFRFHLVDGRTYDLYPRKNRLLQHKGSVWYNFGITKMKNILGI